MSQKTSGGIGFLGGLTILFIGLKLTGVIDWGWLWILSPMWLPVILLFLLVFLCEYFSISDPKTSRWR